MNDLIDKLIIYIACFALYIVDGGFSISVPPVLVAITVSALLSYHSTDKKALIRQINSCRKLNNKLLKLGLAGAYFLLCQWQPPFIVFLPLICYDIFAEKNQFFSLLALIPVISHLEQGLLNMLVMLIVLLMLSYILKYRTKSFTDIKSTFAKYIDNSQEIALLLKKSNRDLIEKQDYEINVAMLNERNRIAMEIHDNVGHLLSRCLLQIGAIMAINKDENFKESLSSVKETLSSAMDSIRSSVHNLHDEAIDLYSQIKSLITNFTFCRIDLDYDLSENINIKLKYCFIAIIKEALSNIIKHSDASEVNVALREHPALYQLIIQDNGHNSSYSPENGIGLINISDRVSTFNGNIYINTGNGFRIFISIPKTAGSSYNLT
ncbi:signal transduction histidine kinase [Ruminiclostridium sufflavum DSM 19573]|uniref:histidine kinase n=1 Tax=Ruminiclostridium sufflavum DSM 19573 TaxID=1121337 RepID=A0A318XI31_9FIRM|nr:histidine kinase [Ruminiclostridium sufflavum]PYG85003.1 signal transduction histidine kinase [Ruminiclostridium sufflavum DSM 19573]